MRYLSVCSGIEAATVAWHPLGWQPVAFSEIEPFPCAVLAHHYPHVPNLGDMTRYHEWPAPCTCKVCAAVSQSTFSIGKHTYQIYVCSTCGGLSIHLLAGGTPCQGFSISGLRKGLDDPRSQLSLTYVEIAARYRPRWLVWENVPGVLSSAGGRDFAAILGALTGREIPVPQDGWENSGVVEGIPDAYGIAWRVVDAQFFGVPQRRRRVFLVGYLGDWRRAAAVLFERHSLQGHPAPRRQTGQNVAPTISARTKGGGGLGTDFDCDGGLIASPEIFRGTGAGYWDSGLGSLRAHAGGQHENLIVADVAATLPAGGNSTGGERQPGTSAETAASYLVAHALTGEGFDASEDGTVRGTPIVPVAFSPQAGGKQTTLGYDENSQTSQTLVVGQTPAIAFDTTQITSKENRSNPQPDAPCHTLSGEAHPPAIAIQERAIAENPDSGPDGIGIRTDDTAYTLEARTTVQAVAFETRCARNDRGMPDTVVPALKDDAGKTGKGDAAPCVVHGMAVRRLTPRECERLQGFPDDYTLIPTKAARKLERDMLEYLLFTEPTLSVAECERLVADGPRYKSLGNSWARPCAEWIGRRIAKVETKIPEEVAA